MCIRRALQDLFDGYALAYRAGDAAGCAACFTQDAKLISPFAPMAAGRDAIKRTHAEWLAEEGEHKTIVVIEAGQSGGTAWCLARYSEDDVSEDGSSLNVLERQQNGEWLIRMCSLNEN